MMAKPDRRILDWRRRRSWLASIRYYASDVLTPDVREQIAQGRPECWSDDMSWLPDHHWLVDEFCDRMVGYYTHFKAFHGCRPIDMGSYLRDGLVGQNKDHIQQVFRQMFSEYPPEQMDRAIAQFEPDRPSEAGKVWLLGCDEELVTECGHYLIQGSEYLMALAGAIGGFSAQRRLRDVGVPTLIEVDLPASYVSATQHMEIARSILSAWGQRVARRPLGFGSGAPCFVVRRDIPPEHLRGHHHPARIVDPHRGHLAYDNPYQTCPACTVF